MSHKPQPETPKAGSKDLETDAGDRFPDNIDPETATREEKKRINNAIRQSRFRENARSIFYLFLERTEVSCNTYYYVSYHLNRRG